MQDFKKHPKYFFSYGHKVIYPVGPLEKEDGSVTEGSTECAEVLSKFFISVFVIEDTSNIPVSPTQVSQHMLEFNIAEEWSLRN